MAQNWHSCDIVRVPFFIYDLGMKEVNIIVSKLYEYADAYDYEWAVPEFPSRDNQSERRERCESISNDAEFVRSALGRKQSYHLAGAD